MRLDPACRRNRLSVAHPARRDSAQPDIAVATQPGRHPVGVGHAAQRVQLDRDRRGQPGGELDRFVGGVGMLRHDDVDDAGRQQVDRADALRGRQFGGVLGVAEHDRAGALRRQRREPAVQRGQHPVGGHHRQRGPAAALTEQHRHRRGVQGDQLSQAVRDLAGQAALFGLGRQRGPGGVDDQHQRQV